MIALTAQPFVNPDLVRERLGAFVRDANRWSCGTWVAEFETRFAAWQGRSHAVCFNSGSSANLALIQSLLNLERLDRGDVVGYSALTWATNVMPLVQLGLIPEAIDIEPHTLNVCRDVIAEAYDSDRAPMRALFLTHALGFCSDVTQIERWCLENRVLLLEDACEALGSEQAGRKLGNFGLASTFSFFVGHHLSTVEGGMVATDDDGLAEMLRMVRAHGWAREVSRPLQDKLEAQHGVDPFRAPYTFYVPGYNLRPTEMTGVIGCAQMGEADGVVSARERNFQALAEAARKREDITRLSLRMDRVSAFAFPIVCANHEAFERLSARFAEHAEIRPVIGGCMMAQPFLGGESNRACPNARQVHHLGFYFACRHDLTPGEVALLCALLEEP